MKRIKSLDGLRALSIAFVLIGHWSNQLIHRGYPVHHLLWWADGGLGVFIFFIISGYLITYLLLAEQEKTKSLHLGKFYFRRFFRIVPPLYFYIAFTIVMGWFTYLKPTQFEILTALTFTRNLTMHHMSFLYEHFWSLCIEEQFYLIWPVLLFFALRRKGKKTAARLAIVLILAAPIYRIGVHFLTHDSQLRHFLEPLLPGQMDALMFGCLAALTQGTPLFESIYRRASKIIWFFPIWFFVISNYITARYGDHFARAFGHTLDGIAVTLWLIWCTRNPDSFTGKILNWKPVVHLGVISYSVYIWQTYFLHPDNHLIIGYFPWNFLCIFAAAEFSFYVVERWSRMTRDRLQPRVFKSERRFTPESSPAVSN